MKTLIVFIFIITYINGLPTSFTKRVTVQDSIPGLTQTLFQEYNNQYYNQQAFLNSGNIDLNSNSHNKLFYYAKKLVNRVKHTLNLYGQSQNNIYVINNEQLTPVRTVNVQTDVPVFQPENTVRNTESFLPKAGNIQSFITVVNTEKPAVVFQPTIQQFTEKNTGRNTESFLPKAGNIQPFFTVVNTEKPAVIFQPNVQQFTEKNTAEATEKNVARTTENYELTEEDIKIFATTRKAEITTNNPEITENKDDVTFFSRLSVPHEDALNLFVTSNMEDLDNFPKLNLTKLTVPEENLNVFFTEKNTSFDEAKVFKLIYNFPLPKPDSHTNFRVNFHDIESEFHSQFGEQIPPRNIANGVVKHEIINMELPVKDSGTFHGHVVTSRQNGDGQIGETNVDNVFSNLGEIPLDSSPVFDLNKMNLVNSYGKSVQEFKK